MSAIPLDLSEDFAIDRNAELVHILNVIQSRLGRWNLEYYRSIILNGWKRRAESLDSRRLISAGLR